MINLNQELRGKSALITGSSRGIGAAMITALARAGANVAVHSSGPSEMGEAVKKQCEDEGVKACLLRGDLSEKDVPARLLDECAAALGGVDILVLNASVQFRRDWSDWNTEEADTVLGVNVRASAEMMTRVLPQMQKAGWGRVVTIGSVQQNIPNPAMALYAATKCAQLSLAKSYAVQVAKDGVTINNLAPGVIQTDRNVEALADESYREKIAGLIPSRTFGMPEDCAGALLMLCSEAGRYITGADIAIDGGMGLGAH
ncbi:SDR family oxidoreductase [Kiritimatiellaeota bacterium B1221]|nr:SDR family oxidoreductase [Kiritimatiellaeota bacterium B1221]